MTIVMRIGKMTVNVRVELCESIANTRCNRCGHVIVIAGYVEVTPKWYDHGTGLCAVCASDMAS